MYKEDLAINNLQWMICHKTKPNQTKKPLGRPCISDMKNMKIISTFQVRKIFLPTLNIYIQSPVSGA